MSQWKGKTRGGSTGYAIFIFLIKHCGVKAAYALLWLVVPYFVVFAPSATHSSWRYWRRIHKEGVFKSFCRLFQHYYRFGQVIIDKVATSSGLESKYTFEFDGVDEMESVLKSDKGAIMIGAHFGNWEVSRVFMKEFGKKINVVMLDAEYEKIKEKLEDVMGQRTFGVIPVSKDNIDHIFAINTALNSGEFVCFQGDRYLNDERVENVNFLGEKADFPVGPYQLGAKMGVDVFFFFVVRQNGMKYRISAVKATKYLEADRKGRQSALLGEYLEVLESQVNNNPEQWFNFYDFWNFSKKQ